MEIVSASQWAVMFALLSAIGAASFINRIFGVSVVHNRYATLDGLRGYLAFFVFLHHSSIWYFYLRNGQWASPPSHLFNHFGQASVVLFFMITGFLFFSKVIESKNKPIKWGRLFIGRIMRLVPMYIFSILLLFLIVAVLSDGSINDSANNLFHGLLQWLTFTLKSAPNLNGVNNTFIINAGVSWSLVYEWYFYLSLPTLMFIVKGKPPIGYAIIGSIGLTLLINLPHRTLLLAFVGGMVAAVSVRFEGLRKFCEKPLCSFMVMVLISVAITRFYYVYKVVPIILLALSFIIIVNGNTLFGILIHPVSRVLGEISYSIYLLHGIVLFVTFNFIIGLDTARSLTPIIHWVVVVGVVPILILISFMTFRYIETPFMQRSLKIT